ncbi:MAG TPA: effector-associated domain EAD1-containing protein, partial [Candidatus Nanopelagicales bacterium]|nr:effector-associated domain EAD1-containing protein [Candidatus Nanopelagicales bacterium]
LDEGAWPASNEAACRAFWDHHAGEFSPPLDPAFVDEAVRRAGGNLLHAIRLRDWLEGQPAERRVATDIPDGLTGFLRQIWADLSSNLDEARLAPVIDGLGAACAAREALPASLFAELLGWPSIREREEFLRATRPFLLEEPAHWHSGQPAYRPYHESFREFVAQELGEHTLREHHLRLARTLAAWPQAGQDARRKGYALRHAVAHRIEAGELEEAEALCLDVGYLEEKCRALGVSAVERDLEAVLRALGGERALGLSAVLAALGAEAGRLRVDPASLPGLLYNRLRCAGFPEKQIREALDFGKHLPPLRLLHGVRLGPTLLRALPGHDKPVVACAVTPDGNQLLSASADRTLRLWAMGSGDCIAVLRGHDDEITACVLSPDGRAAVSASADGTARLWDLGARRCVATLDNGGRWATACAVTPDGALIVVGSDDGAITVWDRASLRRIVALTGHTDYVTACVATRDGRVISASRDQSVRVWDLRSGACAHALGRAEAGLGATPHGQEEQGWITALALRMEGREVLAAAGDGSLTRWDLRAGRCVRRFGAGQGRVDACAALPDGRYVLCGMADGTLAVWDLAAERRALAVPAHMGAVSACATTADGRRIVSASHDRTIKLWELGGQESLVSQEGHAGPITACAVTPDGKTAVSASEDRTLKVWDVESGACRATLEGHEDLVTGCAISDDGLRVQSEARDGSVRLWRIESAGAVSVERHEAEASGGGELKGWDFASGRRGPAMQSLEAPVLAGAVSRDRRRAVLAREDGQIEVRDLRTQALLRVMGKHAGRVFGCAVSPDGARVASASEDGTLKVWRLEGGQCLGTLHGTSWFRCVAMGEGVICAGDQEGNLWMIADETAALGRAEREVRRLSPPRGTPSAKFGTTDKGGAKVLTNPTGQRSGRTEARATLSRIAPLRSVLAFLYGSAASAEIIAVDVGLDITLLSLGGSPQECWFEILKQAVLSQRLDELLRRVLQDFPEHRALLAAARDLGFDDGGPR